MILKNDRFTLPHFEGTLDFLLCLLQKEEIDIYDVSVEEIIRQFVSGFVSSDPAGIDRGAEFIGSASYLIWLKSKMLLPEDQTVSEPEEEIDDPRFEIIHHLVDYCRFKRAGQELARQQDKQRQLYFRGIDTFEPKKLPGIDHLSLEDLSLLFQGMIERAAQHTGSIEEENWQIADKISVIRKRLSGQKSFDFADLFHASQTRSELIVIFLAILELMKSGDLSIVRKEHDSTLTVVRTERSKT